MVRAAALLLVALAGCAAEPPAPAQQHGEVLAAADRRHGGLDRTPTPELRRYCMSAYWAKQRDKLAACLAEIEARRKWLGVYGVRDCREASHACDLLARELHLGALSALDAGAYGEAIRLAADLRAMRRERYEAVDALGILAVATALSGEKPDRFLKELRSFGFGPFSGLFYERIWLARAYMAARDYENAYAEVRRIDFGFDTLIERTAAAYAPTGESDGYRFILGKSALETGRLDQAQAAFSALHDSKGLDASKTGRVVSPGDLERDRARLQRR
jgi:hypothetical protein